jgi:hypothetical protein
MRTDGPIKKVGLAKMRPNVERQITFGPFRMAHLREQADERFERAFFCYLVEKVIPLLDGEVTRIAGRIFSHYDQPEFAAMAEVRSRYYYDLSFTSDGGSEEGWGELDYDSASAAWVPSRIKPPSVRTLTHKREVKQLWETSLKSLSCDTPRPTECPLCHSPRVADILYGYVLGIKDLQADLESGKLYLGGCFISEASPLWRCMACGHSWGAPPKGAP